MTESNSTNGKPRVELQFKWLKTIINVSVTITSIPVTIPIIFSIVWTRINLTIDISDREIYDELFSADPK